MQYRSWGLFLIALLVFIQPIAAEERQPHLVTFKTRTADSPAEKKRKIIARLAEHGLRPEIIVSEAALALVRVNAEEVKILRANKQVSNVDFNYSREPFKETNDPAYQYQWGLPAIGAPTAWDISVGSSAIVVGVIDTGIDWTHPDLKNNIWVNSAEIPNNGLDDDGNGYFDDIIGWDFGDTDNNPLDSDGHGTHVSGIIAAQGNNSIGVSGVSWNSKILPLRVGGQSFSDISIISAIYYAIALKKRGEPIVALNMSLGGPGFSSTLMNACADAGAAGIAIVAAAGNGGKDGIGDNNDLLPIYPGNFSQYLANVISVASVGSSLDLSSFSNFGTSVAVAAPGQDIASTYPTYDLVAPSYAYMTGTSMATPFVSGVLALLGSVKNSLPAEAIKVLIDSVKPVPNLTGLVASGGVVDAAAALATIENLAAPPPLVPQFVISGVVTIKGKPKKAQVQLKTPAGIVPKLKVKAKTDKSGHYAFAVQPGTYEVKAVVKKKEKKVVIKATTTVVNTNVEQPLNK